MAGNSEGPLLPEDKGASKEEVKAKKPLARTFHCTNCGASVTLRCPGATLSVVCDSCHSIIDATDPNYRVLVKYYKATASYTPLLDLGLRGELKGRTWEVIGFMVRSDCVSRYHWEEYLLFNPYYGYRWLTQDKGHWNFVTPIKQKPQSGSSNNCYLDGKQFKLYNRGDAQVDYVVGEFYWRVMINSRVLMTDYIDPPRMLSSEKDDTEINWSLSEYITPAEIHAAFKPTKKLPYPVGVSATYPPKYKKTDDRIKLLFVLFWGIITCAQIYCAGTSLNDVAAQYNGTFVPNTKKADTTIPVFELKKDLANVFINVHANVSNSWFWIGGELVNDDTGVSYPIDTSVEYYYGTDSDGAWSEGGTTATAKIAQVPKGKYYINFDYESGDFKQLGGPTLQDFGVVVTRDVPTYDNYVWTFLGLLLGPLLSFAIMRKTEVARWENSDFSPYATSSYSSSYD